MHGRKDEVIPFDHSERLLKMLTGGNVVGGRLRSGSGQMSIGNGESGSEDGDMSGASKTTDGDESKRVVKMVEFPRAGHNDIDFGDMVDGIEAFLRKVGI